MHRSQPRVRYIDGLRGLAIAAVMIYHYFGPTYVDVLPYHGRFATNPIAHYGWSGVYLFFLISGFVIFATLERCASLPEFLWRRWLRLFPAMLVTTVPVFLISRSSGIRQLGNAHEAFSLLPGLTFISPAFYHAATHLGFDSVDGVYWTLYTEVAFYLIFGCLYFVLGSRPAIVALVLLGVATRWGPDVIRLAGITGPLRRAIEPFEWASVSAFPWFASGILFYRARDRVRGAELGLAVLTGLLAVWTTGSGRHLGDGLALAFMLTLFTAAQLWPALQRVLEWRGLLFLGFISYPLYLLHNNLGLIAIHALGARIGADATAAAVILVATIAGVLAWIVARYAEPALRAGLLRLAPGRVRRDRPISAGSGASP